MASGDLLAHFRPQSVEPPDSNPVMLGLRKGHPNLSFSWSSESVAHFTGILPWCYSGGGITASAIASFSQDTNTSHTGRLLISFERIAPGLQDLDVDGFAAAKNVTVDVPAISGHTSMGSVAFSDGAEIDNLAAGEMFRLKVVCDSANSDFQLFLELLAVTLRETP